MAETTRADNFIEAWRNYGGAQLRQHLQQAFAASLDALAGIESNTFTEDDLAAVGRLRDLSNALIVEAAIAVTSQPKTGPRASRISVRRAADLLGSSRTQLPLWAKQAEALTTPPRK